MAKTSNRRIKIFLNGKAVEASIKDVKKQFRLLNNQIGDTKIGSEEYVKKSKEIARLSGIIKQHRNDIRGIQGSYKKVSGGLSKFLGIAGIAFGASEIIGYGKRVLDLGISMDTLNRKAQTVFGDALPQVTREAEKNATAMGLTASQYTDAATAIADLLIPMGFQREESAAISTELVNLSGALSEWTGGQKSATEVSEILQKALLGEREQLKTLGISIQEADVKARLAEKGLDKLTGTMLQQAKAAATLELITEKTADAQTAFADGSGTVIRRQAELTAKFQETQEKIATILLPVFEKLLSTLSDVADVTANVVNFFGRLADPIGAATNAFDEQAQTVADLESELPALLTRYDELKDKSTKTEAEQKELSKTIQRIGEITPTAITQIDEYGNILSINADASRDFLEAEKERLLFVNKESIKSIQDQINELENLAAIEKRIAEGGKAGILQLEISAERVNEARLQYAKLSKEIAGANAELNRLKGNSTTTQNKSGTKTPEEIAAEKAKAVEAEEKLRKIAAAESRSKEQAKQTERELKALEKKQAKLLETVQKFQEELLLSELTEDERKIKQLELKFQKEIDIAKELEVKKITGATAARIELEKIAQEQISTLRQQLQNEAFKKEQEAELENRKANDAKIQEYEAAKLEAEKVIQDEIRQTIFDERALELLDLEAHYTELVALAETYDIDTLSLEINLEKKRKELKDKYRNEDLQSEKNLAKAKQELQLAELGAFRGFTNSLQQLAGDNAAISNSLFLFEKGLAASEIIIKLQTQLAAIRAKYALIPGGIALAAVESAKARVDAGLGLGVIAATGIAKLTQKKKGGWLDARGQDDNVSYRAKYIGSPSSGMLPSHPVVLASEAGAEYFVSNKSLQNPYVLDHVRAIENITKMRQFRDGGSTDALPTTTSPPPSTTSESGEINTALAAELSRLNNNLESGIMALIDDDSVVDIFKKFNQLNSSAGGALIQ